jgi:hypothetical protein
MAQAGDDFEKGAENGVQESLGLIGALTRQFAAESPARLLHSDAANARDDSP